MAPKPKIYAVVDIETTGGMAKRDRITEIAIALFDGKKIVDTFQSLVNPQRSIPTEITRITGITNEMVANAPKFYEIAKKVVTMTEGAIFVAHNVRFDYSFLREEFSSLGFAFTRKQLCTVALSRKAFPGLRSYSLGNLIAHFGIQVENRHRAMDDVLATVQVLQNAIATEDGVHRADRLINSGITASKLPKNVSLERIHSLPEATGVYYFYNEYGTIIYIGKSINIKKRIMQHFGNIDQKTDAFIAKVADITYTETGSELIAMLLESSEIKAFQPEVNKAQRSKNYPYFVYQSKDESGYICLHWEKTSVKTTKNKNILNYYSSKSGAIGNIARVTNEFQLCSGKNNLHDCGQGCFFFQTGMCFGAGMEKEDVEDYNSRAMEAVHSLYKGFEQDFYFFVEGRNFEEKTVVMIKDGHYRGFGYIVSDSIIIDSDQWDDYIQYYPQNPECNQFVITFLEKNPFVKRWLIS